MIAAILLVGSLLQEQAPVGLTPALDYGSRTTSEWMQLLDIEGSATTAAWCLYYADQRNPAVVDALKRALSTPAALDAHIPIDAILADWGIPFEPLSASAFCPDGQVKAAAELFAAPLLSDRTTTEQLALDLTSEDPTRAIPAAMTLLARDELAASALPRLVDAIDDPRFFNDVTRSQLRAQAGRGLGEEIGSRIARCLADGRLDAPEIPNWLANLEGCMPCIAGAASVLADLAASAAPTAARAASLLPEASHPAWEDTLEDGKFHESWRSEPADDPELEAVLARYYGRLVDLAARAQHVDTALLASLHTRIQSYPAIASAITPGLLKLLDTDTAGRLEVLRLLCHARCEDQRVRAAWLEVARTWTDTSADGLEQFPCLARHDADTRVVLVDVMRRAERVYPFGDKLAFAGELDADRSVAARFFLDHLEGEDWAWIRSQGFRGLVSEPISMPEAIRDEHATQAQRATRMNRLALNCATRKDRGLETTEDEAAIVAMLELDYRYGGAGGFGDYVQWGWFHARDLGLHSAALVDSAFEFIGPTFPDSDGWSTHSDAALAYLEDAELTLAQQVELGRRVPYLEPGYRIRGINLVSTRYDGRSAGKVALERTPAIRSALYAGNIMALEELVRVTRLVDRDVDYLLAVVARGTAEARAWALELVEQESLDTPRVRAAVRLRLADVDSSVRRRARALADRHGW